MNVVVDSKSRTTRVMSDKLALFPSVLDDVSVVEYRYCYPRLVLQSHHILMHAESHLTILSWAPESLNCFQSRPVGTVN